MIWEGGEGVRSEGDAVLRGSIWTPALYPSKGQRGGKSRIDALVKAPGVGVRQRGQT